MKKMAISCLMGIVIIVGGVTLLPQPTMCVTMSIVTVTAYHPGVYDPCTGKRGVTASGLRVHEGFVAVSRDVERSLNLGFGDRVLLHGLGVFEFQDRMAARCRKKVDIYMDCTRKARRFGVRRYVVLVKLA
jgi:3D (Asp-Asp-Asp) domain-containing protein